MNKIRVVLADDHTILRAGVRKLLEAAPEMEVMAEACNGQEALELAKQHRPRVLLSDIAMPILNGLELTARLAKECPQVRVIILSMHSGEDYVRRALAAGAAGYLLKDTTAAELEFAIKAVAGGETYLTPAVSRHVIDDYRRRWAAAESPLERLTGRQREILQLIAEGRSTKEIARVLKISVKTAETHRSQLMERLDIHDVAGLVRFAIRAGLIQPE